MKTYLAHSISVIICAVALSYVARTEQVSLWIIVIACAAIFINYQLLLPTQSTKKIPS